MSQFLLILASCILIAYGKKFTCVESLKCMEDYKVQNCDVQIILSKKDEQINQDTVDHSVDLAKRMMWPQYFFKVDSTTRNQLQEDLARQFINRLLNNDV